MNDVAPIGKLIKYVRIPDPSPSGSLVAPTLRTTNTLGLLREYPIRWKLTVQPGRQGREYSYRLDANPGTNLVYRMSPGDPEWGAYSVLMYSAFYDFSNRLLTGVGLLPPTAPSL